MRLPTVLAGLTISTSLLGCSRHTRPPVASTLQNLPPTVILPESEPAAPTTDPEAGAPLLEEAQPAVAPGGMAAAPSQPVDQPSFSRGRAGFSGKRLLVTALVGGVAGGVLGYLTYNSMCSDESEGCFGGAMAGLGVNMVVTPLAVYGIGTAMGGRGSLLSTYLGALAPFGVSAAPGQEVAAFVIGTILMPFGAAAFYEVSSHIRSAAPPATMNIQPTTAANGAIDGAFVSFSGRF